MIGRLRGVLTSKTPPWLVVDVCGVGYELEVPMSTFCELPDVGYEVNLFTHYTQKDDSAALYGFLSESERRLFRHLQRVSGIGTKIALAILSSVSVDTFAGLIQAGDANALTVIPGIGKKTAERMLVELRDRAADFNNGISTSGKLNLDTVSEAALALQQLGYKPAEAARMARDAGTESDDVAIVIKKALQTVLR
ncbi:Holliday junction branch migration protein RuvA [Xylella fastidiosa subsp. morus]|uniref:Holliday junction branch migration complex subunit RuvA n=1 Tax=Xylella fastidiosa subsp. fastidiosa TaxID=644356 RepID=A0AAJ5UJJ6_XYLFS|nr:Holliday junction branch migration protein RuvA [Xylella fastidiosa]AIC12418.1 Holliday junction DNA helicase RuvA [Xylella fastidiosa MUL0034]EWG14318.1 Holliday junction DNA helicase RuvA [Xylella fastidiosa Mul-MD]KQH74496.1 ATP-dependent DNA helicase RuvA [Xylella fastidiosa]RWA45083.1 Holliday junction branch migration protein RuvA [Xylella fastidiosa subsp. sandyi]TNV99521.1 Holliday junction branch migration protein RuvA [Xylella fastidiosa]